MITAERFHDFSYGHRVHGHENKCAFIHGHNGRAHFKVGAFDAGLDDVGRVLDFSVIKSKLCVWLEENWDHKFLAWEDDEIMKRIYQDSQEHGNIDSGTTLAASIVWVPFNPTAENMALHLLHEIGPLQLQGTGCQLISVTIEETRKCQATASL